MAGNDAVNKYSAVDAALGYLYQVRLALLYALRRQKSDGDFLVSLETLDDVTFHSDAGTPTDLLQTKHHRSRTASLSDASSDLWKTLRIWFEGRADDSIPPNASLYLITTGNAADGSVAACLRAEDRDVQSALFALNATANTSENTDNQKAYEAYLKADIVGSIYSADDHRRQHS